MHSAVERLQENSDRLSYVFEIILGIGAKPSSLFANLTSPAATITSTTTTNAQPSSGGLFFGTTPATTTTGNWLRLTYSLFIFYKPFEDII